MKINFFTKILSLAHPSFKSRYLTQNCYLMRSAPVLEQHPPGNQIPYRSTQKLPGHGIFYTTNAQPFLVKYHCCSFKKHTLLIMKEILQEISIDLLTKALCVRLDTKVKRTIICLTHKKSMFIK